MGQGEGEESEKIWGVSYVQNKYTLYRIRNDRRTGHETDQRSQWKRKEPKIEGVKERAGRKHLKDR